MGGLGLLIAMALFALIPKTTIEVRRGDRVQGTFRALAIVFKNPQSVLCGLIAGLLFIPTTIFSMVWGIRFLQEAHGFEYGEAVIRSSTVPLGWMIGCPLLGWLSDRIGLRRPVIMGGASLLLVCLVWSLYGNTDLLPPYILGFGAGLGSGAAMLTYTVIKEANPPEFSGTATGVLNFVNFTFSALMGPMFGWVMQSVSASERTFLERYQLTFAFLIYGVVSAVVLTVILKETGPAAIRAVPAMAKTA
jgi:MFS family permease